MCVAYQKSPVIFVGKVTAIKKSSGSVIDATFAVTEKIKGSPGDTETVGGGGLCGAWFEEGKSYVVYASGTPGSRLTASLCSRTALVDRAKNDLAYARGLAKRTTAIVAGQVTVQERTGPAARADVEIRATGADPKAKPIRSRTDKRGNFTLELPPGTYTLELGDAKTKLAKAESVELADAKACVERDLAVAWNGRVRGRVTGSDGKPAANVKLTLIASGGANQFATTDKDGVFEASGVPAGGYTIAAYKDAGVATTTYYPGVTDAKKAKAILLGHAGLIEKINFKLAP